MLTIREVEDFCQRMADTDFRKIDGYYGISQRQKESLIELECACRKYNLIYLIDLEKRCS